MRTLRFIVDAENIKCDPACDFSGLFPGRNPHIRAEFTFTPEWNDKAKVVAFWSILDAEYEPQELDNDSSCVIPSEALSRASFKIQVLGKRGNTKLITNKLTVRQTGGR